MKPKAIYNRKSYVLGSCNVCMRLNYVEPHGTTAYCPRCDHCTEHSNIPHECRDMSGYYMVRPLISFDYGNGK